MGLAGGRITLGAHFGKLDAANFFASVVLRDVLVHEE